MPTDRSEQPSVPITDEVAFATRTPGPGRLRVGLVGAVVVALALGAVATSFAASPAPLSSDNGSTQGTPFLAPGPVLDQTVDLDHGRFGGRGMLREVSITAISGSNIKLGTADGWTRTIALTDSIELTEGGQAITGSDLAVGDQIRFRQTRNDDGTYTVTAMAVVVPSVGGVVSEKSSSGFKVTTRDGSVWTIAINGSTAYRYGPAGTGSLADVTNGAKVRVEGATTDDNALTALTVRVAGDRAMGTVTAKTADTITVTRDGSAVTVHVDADTTYQVAGVTTATLANVTVDMTIGVAGRARADGSIDADRIIAGDGRGFGRGGHGRGGSNGPDFGPGAGGPASSDADPDSGS